MAIPVLLLTLFSHLAWAQTAYPPEQTTMSPAQRQKEAVLAAALENYTYALKDAHDNLKEAERWYNETKIITAAKVQETVDEVKKQVKEEFDNAPEKGRLEAKYQSSVNQLSKLTSRNLQPVSLDEIQTAKEAADSALQASKGLAKLEKGKAHALMREYRTRRNEAKNKARYLQKKVQKAAREAFKVARKVESAGRKAGQKEKEYEGDYEHAEKVTEKLSGRGEKFGEGAEGHVEKFFEKVEDKLEDARDEAEHEAQSQASIRERRVNDLKKEVLQRATPAPAPEPPAVMMASSNLRSQPARSGEELLPISLLLLAGTACAASFAATAAWVHCRTRTWVATPELALG